MIAREDREDTDDESIFQWGTTAEVAGALVRLGRYGTLSLAQLGENHLFGLGIFGSLAPGVRG